MIDGGDLLVFHDHQKSAAIAADVVLPHAACANRGDHFIRPDANSGTDRHDCCLDKVESGHGGRTERSRLSTLEERIATLEGRMTPDLREELQRGFTDTRQEFGAVREEMQRGFAELREEMGRMRQDLTRGFERVDDRMHRQFTRIISIQLTMMATMLGVLVAALFRNV